MKTYRKIKLKRAIKKLSSYVPTTWHNCMRLNKYEHKLDGLSY